MKESFILKGHIQRQFWRDKFIVGQEVLVTNLAIKKARLSIARVYGVFQNHIVFQYKCFHPQGTFRGYQYVSVSFQSFLCGDERVVFLYE